MDNFGSSRPVRIGIAAFTLVAFAAYVCVVSSLWRADVLQDQRARASLEAAARLQPWNAQTQWLLGRYFLNGPQDYPSALEFLQRAVKLDPYEGRYWIDLAVVHEVRGEANESQEALQRALQVEPTSTEIAWETANFYLAQNDTNRALPLFRVALQHAPQNTVAILSLCWRATNNVSQIVSQALPTQPAPYFDFLKILTGQNQSSSANELWQDLIAQKFRFPVGEAFPYFDYLIQPQQIDQAKKVWTDLTTLHPELPGDTASNLVHDGGFEAEFLNGGFGWRSRQTGQISVLLDTSEVHTGTRSLRLGFAGPAVADVGVYEYVPVQPSTAYKLSAFVKTEKLTTASGPRLAVEDFSTKEMLGTTNEFLDTSGWRLRTAEFVTRTDTHLVTIRILRIPGNPLIKGTFWLDDVELVPASPGERATPAK
jgi:tetratricopeptide (TPR) repeat protein